MCLVLPRHCSRQDWQCVNGLKGQRALGRPIGFPFPDEIQSERTIDPSTESEISIADARVEDRFRRRL